MAVAKVPTSLLAGLVLMVLVFGGAPGVAGEDEVPVPRQAADDWAMYGHDATHGFANSANPPELLGLVWEVAGNVSIGSAVQSEGFVYAADRAASQQAEERDLVVWKLAEADGALIWTARIRFPEGVPLGPSRTLAVDGARVYAVVTVHDSVLNQSREVMVALDIADGGIVWRFTGTTAWTSMSPAATQSAPVVWGSVVVFGSQDGRVYAVNAATGAPRWSHDAGVSIQSVPAAFGDAVSDIVYVTAGTRLLYLDVNGTANGVQGIAGPGGSDLLDEVAGMGAVQGSPTVYSSSVYFVADGNLSAVHRVQGGQPIWSEESPFQAFGGRSTPAIAANFVVVRRDDGRVYAYETATGRISWIAVVGGASAGGGDIAAADNRIFLTSTNTNALITLDSRNGEVLGETPLPDAPLGAPIVAGDKVLVSSGTALLALRGQPDLAPDKVVMTRGTVTGNAAVANVTVTVKNLGNEPASGVQVEVYDGARTASGVLIGGFTIGSPTSPLQPNAIATLNTADRGWSVGQHEVWVYVDPAPTETSTANNEQAFPIFVQPGPPPPPTVLGAGPYALALLGGFGVGILVLWFPMQRLRELRRKENEK